MARPGTRQAAFNQQSRAHSKWAGKELKVWQLNNLGLSELREYMYRDMTEAEVREFEREYEEAVEAWQKKR